MSETHAGGPVRSVRLLLTAQRAGKQRRANAAMEGDRATICGWIGHIGCRDFGQVDSNSLSLRALMTAGANIKGSPGPRLATPVVMRG